MPEFSNNTYNLNAHYSTNSKVEKRPRAVASAPTNINKTKVFNNIDANKKMQSISNDIYQGTEKEKSKSGKTFLKYFTGFLLLILGIKGIRTLLKK